MSVSRTVSEIFSIR